MTRVLFVEPAGNLWGSERSLLDMLDGMSGLDAAVCCPPDTPLEGELLKRGVRTLPYFIAELHNRSRLTRLVAAIGVLRACLRFRPDVIHLNQSGAYRVVLPAAAALGIPVVAHVRIYEDAEYLGDRRPDPKRLRAIIAISDSIERAVRNWKSLEGIPVHRLYDAYTPAPPENVPPVTRSGNAIACVGRVIPGKGQDLLIRALAVLKKRGLTLACRIAGDGDASYVRELQELAVREGLDSIEWLGFVSNAVQQIRGCALLVCPSHQEPLGRVILEAWDAGAVPVVFAASGGAAEIVSAANGGVIYDEQSAESLAASIESALQLGPDERERMLRNGRAWLAANCDVSAYGRAVQKILTDVAATGGPRAS